MARTVVTVDALANPTGTPVETAINAVLAGLTNSVIKAFNLILTDKAPASTRSIRAVIDTQSGGAVLSSAYQVRILEATDDATLVSLANAFMAANPTWFYSPIQYFYSDQAQGQTLRSVGAIVYTSDASGGAANWQSGGSDGGTTVVTVADIDNPVEVAASIGRTQGETLLAQQIVAGGNNLYTLYAWDTAGAVTDSPRVVASTGGKWVAIGGRYVATPAYGPSVVTLADAVTIATDASRGFTFQVTLGGNRTLGNPTGLKDGATYQWIIRQDNAGGRTLAYGNKWTWPGGSVPTIGAAVGAVSVISAVYDGTADRLRAVASLSFA